MISVIIPVYNVQEYLEQCILSVINQTFTDWELILIDDGSTDNSPQICDKYANQYDKISVIHKTNEGVSTARNTGILNANGDYIFFMDSDDYISVGMLDTLYENILLSKTDCVMSSIVYRYDSTGVENALCLPTKYINLSQELNHVYKELNDCKCFNSACGKLFKKSIILKFSLKFEKMYSILEDGMFVVDYLRYCDSIVTLSDEYYYYRQFDGVSLIKRFNGNAIEALAKKYEKEEYLRLYLDRCNLEAYYLDYCNFVWTYIIQIYKLSQYCYTDKYKALCNCMSDPVVNLIYKEVLAGNRSSRKIRFRCILQRKFPILIHILLSLKF